MQLSLITSPQQAHCDDAIPSEARSGNPGRLFAHQNYIFFYFPGVDYSLSRLTDLAFQLKCASENMT